MKALEIKLVAEYAGGELPNGNGERRVHGVSTDSRSIRPGELFIALRGEKFDGHDYVEDAVKAGAIALMVEDRRISLESTAVIYVEDTLAALQKLAGAYRRSLPVRIVGITGSSGKSSAKEMIASVLSRRFKTHKTQGNFNNHIGVPLTLLGLEPEHEWAAVEIGMNRPGEIAPLAELVRPEIAVVTNVGWTHVWTFEGREAIAREKSELVRALPASGISILNADDERVRAMLEESRARTVLVGEGSGYSYGFENVCLKEEEMGFDLFARGKSAKVKLPSMAPHMAANAALAAAVGGEVGLNVAEIVEGLGSTEIPGGRCTIRRWKKGWLVDDTYNASPDSMLAAFEMLKMLPGEGRCVALLGAMGELGDWSRQLHETVGAAAVEKGVDILLALGEDSKWTVEAAKNTGAKRSEWFKNHKDLAAAYQKIARTDDKVLVKGSRSQKMEKVCELLEKSSKNRKKKPSKRKKEGGVPCCFI